jgi:hypothetical protein
VLKNSIYFTNIIVTNDFVKPCEKEEIGFSAVGGRFVVAKTYSFEHRQQL